MAHRLRTVYLERPRKIVCIIRDGQGLPLKGFSAGALGLQQTPAPKPHQSPEEVPKNNRGSWLSYRASMRASLAPSLVNNQWDRPPWFQKDLPRTRQRGERAKAP